MRWAVLGLCGLAMAACADLPREPAPLDFSFDPDLVDFGLAAWTDTQPRVRQVRLWNNGDDRLVLSGLEVLATPGLWDAAALVPGPPPLVLGPHAGYLLEVTYHGDGLVPPSPAGGGVLRVRLEAADGGGDTWGEVALAVAIDCDVDGDGDDAIGCGGEDCADLDATRSSTAAEICNGLDDDCDGALPEDELDADADADADGDGQTSCEGDCDDGDATAFAGNPELCDGVDNDCDGLVPPDELDGDSDGVIACLECDDADDTIYPGAPELCDGNDNDCTGGIPTDELDGDGDGFIGCLDCDDGNASVFPGAAQVCNGIDDSCSGLPPDEVDGDGDGAPACDDCDDGDENANPGADETCDGADNDCDGFVDEGSLRVPEDYASIGEAVEARPGTPSDVVCVGSGVWNEALLIEGTPMSLIGWAGSASTTLSGSGQGGGHLVEVEAVAGFEFSGFAITECVSGLRVMDSIVTGIDLLFEDFDESDPTLAGPAIWSTSSVLSLVDVEISGVERFGGPVVTATGGAVEAVGLYVHDCATNSITVSFVEVEAVVLASTFESNDASSFAVKMVGGTHFVEGSSFLSNSHGGLLLYGGSDVVLRTSQFLGNGAGAFGVHESSNSEASSRTPERWIAENTPTRAQPSAAVTASTMASRSTRGAGSRAGSGCRLRHSRASPWMSLIRAVINPPPARLGCVLMAVLRAAPTAYCRESPSMHRCG